MTGPETRRQAVARMRAAGATFEEIGRVIGTSRQNAYKHWLNHLAGKPERVPGGRRDRRAARDRRAFAAPAQSRVIVVADGQRLEADILGEHDDPRSGERITRYRVMLAPGRTAVVSLPAALNPTDAARLGAIVRALAFRRDQASR